MFDGVVRIDEKMDGKKSGTYIIELPIKAESVNSMYWTKIIKSKKTGKTIPIKYLTHRARKYEQTISKEAYRKYGHIKPLEGKLSLKIDVWFNNNAVHDLDNCCKALIDSLQKGRLIKNDKDIWHIEITRHKGENKIRIEIEEFKDEI